MALRTLLVGGLIVAAIALAAPSAPARTAPQAAGGADAAQRFHDIYTTEWTWRREQFAGADGEDSTALAADHLPRVDAQAQATRAAYWTDVMRRLDGIPQRELAPEDQVNYAIYRAQVQVLLDNQKFQTWQMPFNSDSGFWSDLGFTTRATYRTEKEYRDYLGKLRDIPRYFREQIDNMRLGIQRGYVQPKVVLAGRTQAIAEVAAAAGEASPFYAPFRTMPATIPTQAQSRLRAEALAAIRDQVAPAHAALLAFFEKEYIPHQRDDLAAEDLPDGKAYYRAKIREFTTLDLTADEIHAIGVREMAAIRAQMQDTMREAGFQGSLVEFLHFLRTDPQFYAKSPDELLMKAAWIAKEVDAVIGNYVGRLPRRRFAIEPVPADLAPIYTGGRGGPGIYLVNTYNLPARPLYSLPALTLHESAPGHAFQMPLAEEMTGLPDFRRYSYVSAYGEGWALYCEYLGQEMGLYHTPYERFGYLSYQAWRATRLVVDTGIHHLHWSREQAQAYLRANTALADHEIETEVDRYIAWPAQALSYYLGEMAIRDDRARAEKALGPAFDLRAFHDTVLSLGSVPLPVLHARIDRFIAEGGKAPPAEGPCACDAS